MASRPSSRLISASTAGFLFLVALYGVVGGVLEHTVEPEQSRFNIILLTVESLRADAVSTTLTPNLLKAAQQANGIKFTNHRAVSAWTVPNIIALLSGTHPIHQGVHSRGQSLRSAPANRLANSPASQFQMSSLQPFALIESYAGLGLVREPGLAVDTALATLRRSPSPGGIWYHYLNTHLPHTPHLPDGTQLEPNKPNFDSPLGVTPAKTENSFRRRQRVASQTVVPVAEGRFPAEDRIWVRRYYDSEEVLFDKWFGEFFEKLKKTGLIRNTILIVTADHGEELAERGRVGHASTTREASLAHEILRVPLLIWTPDRKMRAAIDRWAKSGLITDHVDIGMSLPAFAGKGNKKAAKPERKFDFLPISGRNLTVPPHARTSIALTSAAGYAEPNPSTTAYFLISADVESDRIVAKLPPNGNPERLEIIEPAVSTKENPIHKALTERLRQAAAQLTFPVPQTEPRDDKMTSSRIKWIWPDRSGRIDFDDLAGRTRLVWQGSRSTGFIVEYQLGEGAIEMKGRIETSGPKYEFGTIDRNFWESFVRPYKVLRLRVHNKMGSQISDWLTFRLE